MSRPPNPEGIRPTAIAPAAKGGYGGTSRPECPRRRAPTRRARDENMDFRDSAEAASRAALAGAPPRAGPEVASSLCLAVPGATAWPQYLAAVTQIGLNLALLGLFGLGLLLGFLGYPRLGVALLLPTVLGQLCLRSLVAAGLRLYLACRPDSLGRCPGGKRFVVAIEETGSVNRLKLAPEDEGLAVLDARRRLLLIEGVRYRYLLRGQDVEQIAPAVLFGMGGAVLTVRIGGVPLALCLQPTTLGPLGAILRAFLPGVAADRFCRQLAKALTDPADAA